MIYQAIVIFFLMLNVQISWSLEFSESCGKNWTWANPRPEGNSLNASAWSEEQKQYIAVGVSGALLSSADGSTWQTQYSGTQNALRSIAWNGKLWIAVGDNSTLLTSSDGVNWQTQTISQGIMFTDVISSGEQWLAVGLDYINNVDAFLTSSDGINWQYHTSASLSYVQAISWNTKQWIAVGLSGAIVSSTDAINWQQTTLSESSLNDISWNGEQWLIVGSSGIVLSSMDGKSWQQLNQNALYALNSVRWNGSQWLAVGLTVDINSASFNSYVSYMISSIDGTNWSARQVNSNPLNDIIWNGEQWLAVGVNTSILTSTDSRNWLLQTTATSYKDLKDVKWNGSQWLAVGKDGLILSSQNGYDWQKQNSDAPYSLNSIAWNGSYWLVVGDVGTVLTSSDGVNWQYQQSSYYHTLNAVAWNGLQWLIVGSTINLENGTISDLIINIDKDKWQELSAGTSSILNDVHWNGKQWLAAGFYNTIISSEDGLNWQLRTSIDATTFYNTIVWDGNQWLVYAGSSVASSKDGINWSSKVFLDGTLYAIANNGNLWIAVGALGKIVSSKNVADWQQQLLTTSNTLKSIAWNGKQWLAVGQGGTILSSTCYPKTNSVNTHVVIIAGGGNPQDPLQDAINKNSNLAYKTLRQRGIAANNIKYFNALPQDADNDGTIDTQPGIVDKKTIKQAIIQWGSAKLNSQIPMLIYLIDHGGSNIFYLNKPANDFAEIINASEIADWLNTLQENTDTRISLIYDACNSGSFMDELKQSSSQNYDRSLLFSSQADQLAYFGAKGALSYSNFLWNNIGQGMDVRSAHRSATVAVKAVTQNNGKSYQSSVLDDNGDGLDSSLDGALARDTYLGIDKDQQVIYPKISRYKGSETIDLSQTKQIDLFAQVDFSSALDKAQIQRVWAVVIPPNSNTKGSQPITELPVIELDNYNPANGHFSATDESINTIFKQSGQYTISYFVQTTTGINSRFPVVSLLNISDSGYQALEQKDLHVVMVVGGDKLYDPIYYAATNNAQLAYQTLRLRGVNSENIYYLNAQPQDVDADGNIDSEDVSLDINAIENALNQWAKNKINKNTPLLIYFVGDGKDQQFIVNSQQSLAASTLASWVNDLQKTTQARVTFVYDAPESGSFMKAMANLDTTQYERINIFSTAANQGAYFGAQGQLSFSHFFWSHSARGLDVRSAFLDTLKTMRTATSGLSSDSYQQAQLDDNGDGQWNSRADGNLAKVTYLGLNAATAATFPVVFSNQGNQSFNPLEQKTIALSAQVDLPPELIQKVWVLINQPNTNIETISSITQLPEVELNYNVENQSYQGTTSLLTTLGSYSLSYYAQSIDGSISEPLNANIEVTQTAKTSQCATINSNIDLTIACVLLGDDLWHVTLSRVNDSQQSNKLLWQLTTASIDSQLINNAQCTTIDEQLNLVLNCVTVQETDYKVMLNLYPNSQNTQQLFWEFGEIIE